MMRRVFWKRDRLIKYQNERVREIVRYAYENVAFYHELLKRSKIRPRDIQTPQDLNKLPLVRKNDIRNDISSLISNEFDVNRLRKVATSGSTGLPLAVYLRQSEDEFRKAKHLRANMSVGQRPRDRWVMMVPPLRAEEVTMLQRLLGLFVITPVSSYEDIASQLSIIEKAKPEVLDGYSNSLALLAKEVQERRIRSIKPRLVIGGAELISNSSRTLIEDAFGAPFHDQYACIELERMAWQCRERIGYHIDADSIVMQFVDEDGEEAAPGERGEIVCTSLFNHAMPLIRYAVGDVGAASEEATCSCGRTFPLMKLVEGRRDSFVVLPDGRIFAPTAFLAAFDYLECLPLIDQFRLVQKKIDTLNVQVKLKDTNADTEMVEKSLMELFQSALKINTQEVLVRIEFLDSLPLEKSGKFASIISEVDPSAKSY